MARTKSPTATSTKPAQTSRSKTQQKKPPSVPKKPAKPKAKPKAKSTASKFPNHKALFFWDESSKTSGFLAPWYEQPFKVDGTLYQSAGHYIMAEKARVFKDKKTLAALLASKSSAEHKALGNRVKGFQHAIWTEHAYPAAIRANEHKFLHGPQGAALRKKLLPYAKHELVYASPTDHFFGIGRSEEEAGDPGNMRCRARWGENFFGHSFHGVKEEVWRLGNPKAAKRLDKEEEKRREESDFYKRIDELVHW